MSKLGGVEAENIDKAMHVGGIHCEGLLRG